MGSRTWCLALLKGSEEAQGDTPDCVCNGTRPLRLTVWSGCIRVATFTPAAQRWPPRAAPRCGCGQRGSSHFICLRNGTACSLPDNSLHPIGGKALALPNHLLQASLRVYREHAAFDVPVQQTGKRGSEAHASAASGPRGIWAYFPCRRGTGGSLSGRALA